MIWGARCRGGGRGAGLQGGQAAHLVNGKRQLGRFLRNAVELHLRQRMKEEERAECGGYRRAQEQQHGTLMSSAAKNTSYLGTA